MRRQGEVVPKSEILEHVWDFAFDGDDNVVEVHVSALRRKLGSACDRDGPRRRLPDGPACALKWRSSVRSRATVGASLVLAVALVVGARGCSGGLLRRALASDAESQLVDRVDEVEALMSRRAADAGADAHRPRGRPGAGRSTPIGRRRRRHPGLAGTTRLDVIDAPPVGRADDGDRRWSVDRRRARPAVPGRGPHGVDSGRTADDLRRHVARRSASGRAVPAQLVADRPAAAASPSRRG